MEENVVLVQIAIPSRPDVKEYQNLRDEVNRLIGMIEGKYGKLTGLQSVYSPSDC